LPGHYEKDHPRNADTETLKGIAALLFSPVHMVSDADFLRAAQLVGSLADGTLKETMIRLLHARNYVALESLREGGNSAGVPTRHKVKQAAARLRALLPEGVVGEAAPGVGAAVAAGGGAVAAGGGVAVAAGGGAVAAEDEEDSETFMYDPDNEPPLDWGLDGVQ
jgi:hypothetical protein